MKPVVLPELYGIIGDPIAHSLSPFLHTFAFQKNSIPAVLLPWRVAKTELASFMTAFPLLNIRGCCVTLPHKQAILPFLSELTPAAQSVGAVNTLYWSRNRLCGDNTDVIGFVTPLLNELHAKQFKKCLILGSGGAARAAIVGLKMHGYTDITLSGRNQPQAAQLAQKFEIKLLPWALRNTAEANCVINATPLGMQGPRQNDTPYKADWFSSSHGIAYDMVYTPKNTPFCRDAALAGWRTLSGLAMFFAQADAQFKLWTGRTIPKDVFALTEMRMG